MAIRKDPTLFEAAEARAFSGPDEADRQDAVAGLPRAPPPRPAASRVRGPECGAHGAFHAAGPNGGRAVSRHWGTGAPRWVILAPPEPNVEPPRDEQIRGDEPVSTATPDGIRDAHQEQRSQGGTSTSQVRWTDPTSPKRSAPHREGAWFRPVLERTSWSRHGRLVVLIQELTRQASLDLLARTRLGRFACAQGTQPYVVPVYFAYDNELPL